MRAGLLRKRINWKKQSATTNDSGEAVYVYNLQNDGEDPPATLQIAANVRNISRRITTNAGVSQPLGEETFEIRIRYRSGFNIGDRIVYNSDDYVVRGIENVREIDHELVLTCERADA